MQVGARNELHTAKRSSGLDLSDPRLQSAWDDVRSDSDVNWCLFGYPDGSSTKLEFKSSGSDGLKGLLGTLSEDSVTWAGMKISVGGGTKLVRFMFVGSNVGGMKRGKASLHKNTVFNMMEGAACDVSFDGGDGLVDVTREKIIHEIARAVSITDPSIIHLP
mmetsp:Transcript_4737/g.7140  ORF Transcript_4737/g.7140 Transcript_4737/m.7140 type:complete len:162 (-) Transcript_4737:117-602(-)|eukprot:CAMPEP_0171452444 /NCGR_PEP_ID=MMETSP0945-20130129/550_1 /TAXON_ID=109269 /ORGANISM="Vaucheria litorea, Strain CCMP2940" /LENGTH=161 /DNA_ID=CAMNT_0011977113 /DNA_START=68 /DNA_END=553 /DNA_ORIENTATION=+